MFSCACNQGLQISRRKHFFTISSVAKIHILVTESEHNVNYAKWEITGSGHWDIWDDSILSSRWNQKLMVHSSHLHWILFQKLMLSTWKTRLLPVASSNLANRNKNQTTLLNAYKFKQGKLILIHSFAYAEWRVTLYRQKQAHERVFSNSSKFKNHRL